MNRPSPSRQQGFGLLAFVIVTMVVSLSIVLGYTGVLTRMQANRLPINHARYLVEAQDAVLALYSRRAFDYDRVSMGNNLTVTQLLEAAGVRPRYGLEAALSNVLLSPEGTPYRAVALWLPTESDNVNPPDLARFQTTGQFSACQDVSGPCEPRQFAVFDSLALQREASKQTVARLERIAMKAQSYFKARTLQDPEHNVSVNYFRAPDGPGACEVHPLDLGCLDAYTSLATVNGTEKPVPTRAAISLGLSDAELVSGWGRAIQASNLLDSVTDDTPYTMAFRAETPSGTFLTVRAVQQF